MPFAQHFVGRPGVRCSPTGTAPGSWRLRTTPGVADRIEDGHRRDRHVGIAVPREGAAGRKSARRAGREAASVDTLRLLNAIVRQDLVAAIERLDRRAGARSGKAEAFAIAVPRGSAGWHRVGSVTDERRRLAARAPSVRRSRSQCSRASREDRERRRFRQMRAGRPPDTQQAAAGQPDQTATER